MCNQSAIDGVIKIDQQSRLAAQIKTLRACCIGSRAALAKLLFDRQALDDHELRAIVVRLDEVLADAELQTRRREGREDDGTAGYI